MNAGDWKCLFGILVVVILFGALIGFAARAAVIESGQLEKCQAAGYTWSRAYANTVYCIHIDDGRLVGVPLEEVEERR